MKNEENNVIFKSKIFILPLVNKKRGRDMINKFKSVELENRK